MPRSIDPKSLSPRLPQSWSCVDRTTVPGHAELDPLLERKRPKSHWRNAGDIPMTMDPVTRAPMVDPVLCNDGKLHDRLTVRPLPYLDADMTGTHKLQVMGHDLEARATVHQNFPVAARMYKNRVAFATYRLSLGSGGGTRPAVPDAAHTPVNSHEAHLGAQERAYREYQMRDRHGDLELHADDGIRRAPERMRPSVFSRRTFSHFGVLQKRAGAQLVDHLAEHGVLLGRARNARFLGCTENLENALSSFVGPQGPLTRAQSAEVRKYVEFFARMQRDTWQIGAQLEYTEGLWLTNEINRYRYGVNQTPGVRGVQREEAVALARASAFLEDRIVRLKTGIISGTLHDADEQRKGVSHIPNTVPALPRTRSHHDLRLWADPKALDEDVYRCPVFLEPAPSPVLCSDGHTYDLSQVVDGKLTLSPLTRDPVRVVARHDEKQLYASRVIDKPDADYFQETYEGLRYAYSRPKVGGFEDRLIRYQRRTRHFSRHAAPDRISTHVFSAFLGQDIERLSNRESFAAVRCLHIKGVLNRALNHRMMPNITPEKAQQALRRSVRGFDRLKVSQKSDMVRTLVTLHTEQVRRDPLVAQAQLLHAQLARVPQQTPRHAELQAELQRVNRELHKLPSGADDGTDQVLY